MWLSITPAFFVWSCAFGGNKSWLQGKQRFKQWNCTFRQTLHLGDDILTELLALPIFGHLGKKLKTILGIFKSIKYS